MTLDIQLGILGFATLLITTASNTIAGMLLRAGVSLPLYWAGVINDDALTSFALNWYLFDFGGFI
jgi:hypothetical protein